MEGGGSRLGSRFRGTKTPATACLWLFPWMGALEVYDINLRLHARGPGRSISFVSLFVVILHHKRVIWNTLEEIPSAGQKCTEGHTLTVTNFTEST